MDVCYGCEGGLGRDTIEDGLWFTCYLIWVLIWDPRAPTGECLGIYGLRDFTISSMC